MPNTRKKRNTKRTTKRTTKRKRLSSLRSKGTKTATYRGYIQTPSATKIPLPPREWTMPMPPNKWLKNDNKVKKGGLGPSPPKRPASTTFATKIIFLHNSDQKYYSVSLRINEIPEDIAERITDEKTFDDTDKFLFNKTKKRFEHIFKILNTEGPLKIKDFFKNYMEIYKVKNKIRGVTHYTYYWHPKGYGGPTYVFKEKTLLDEIQDKDKDLYSEDNYWSNLGPVITNI